MPFSQDIYLPFGKPTFQKVVLESVNYAVLKGSVYTDDKELFEKNKQQIIFKVNSTPVSLNQDNSFESDKIPVQKISILIQVPEFEDYYKTILLAGGTNNIGPIMLNKKVSSPKIQIKSVNSEEKISTQEVLLNEVVLKTDEEGFLQLVNTQLKNGDILNFKIKGFKEKNVIYNASPEALVIFVEENISKFIPTTYRN